MFLWNALDIDEATIEKCRLNINQISDIFKVIIFENTVEEAHFVYPVYCHLFFYSYLLVTYWYR